jgi:hypothetical protein
MGSDWAKRGIRNSGGRLGNGWANTTTPVAVSGDLIFKR